MVVRRPQRHTVRAGADGAAVMGARPGEGDGITSWSSRGSPTCP